MKDYEQKYQQLLNVSNPDQVLRKLKKLNKNLNLYLSNRKNKKYMIINPYTNKPVHFGAIEYEDYTFHNDETRRKKFKNRNNGWKNHPPYTPGFLSYYLLW